MANWAALQEQLIAKPVAKRARHAIHFKDGNHILANFSGKPCHYLEGGLWKPIDTKLVAVGTEYGAPGLKPRIKTDGTVRIDGTQYNQRSTRIGIFNPTTKRFTAIKTIPLGSLDGDKLIAESGVWRRELRLTEDGLTEEIIIASKPTNTGATLQDWLVLETAVSGVSFPDGWLNDYEVSEFKFPPPSAHDAEGNQADCKRYARTVDGVQYIYTGVSAVWLNNAVYPVVIDPDFEGSTANGQVFGQNATYLTARSTSGSETSNFNTSQVGQIWNGSAFRCYRLYFPFDTSSIGAGATVTQVNLTFTRSSDNSETDFNVEIVKWNGGSTREERYDNILSNDADLSIWANSNDVSNNTPYTSGNLSTAWVSKTGTTNYALRSSRDTSATEPSGNEYIDLYGAKWTTASYRPILTVTYTAASSLHTLSLLGVGK